MGTPSYTPMLNCAGSGGRRYTSPHTRGRSLCHQLLPTSKPGSPRQQSSPHQGLRLLTHLWSPPRSYTPVARVAPTAAWDTAPTPQLQSAQTLAKKPSISKEPTSNGQEKSPKAHGSRKCGIPLPRPLSQSDANGKMSAWKTLTHSTQPCPSAPAPLMASAVQHDPTVMEPSFCPPPSPQLPWALAVSDSGELCLTKAGT